MKSKTSTGTAREGREKQGGPAAGRRLCFHLTHGPLRFMTLVLVVRLTSGMSGRVAERLNAAVLKTVDVVRRPGVQIPPLPPKLFPYFSK